jgi:hypothetical protein
MSISSVTPLVAWRRLTPRVSVEALSRELTDDGHDRYGCVMDLSPTGLRIERPFSAGLQPRMIQLEFEVPEVDEVVWALGEVCFDWVRQVRGHEGPPRLLRSTGIRFAAAADRDLRLLREFVFDKSRAEERLLEQQA